MDQHQRLQALREEARKKIAEYTKIANNAIELQRQVAENYRHIDMAMQNIEGINQRYGVVQQQLLELNYIPPQDLIWRPE